MELLNRYEKPRAKYTVVSMRPYYFSYVLGFDDRRYMTPHHVSPPIRRRLSGVVVGIRNLKFSEGLECADHGIRANRLNVVTVALCLAYSNLYLHRLFELLSCWPV